MSIFGHADLKLIVDHKPLLAIFGSDQDLSELANPRLLNLKLKTNAIRFTPHNVPGKLHLKTSRSQDSPIAAISSPDRNPSPDNNVLEEYKDTFGPPSPQASWKETQNRNSKDMSLRH